MKSVTPRAKFLSAYLPPLSVLVAVAAYAGALYKGHSELVSLAYASAGGISGLGSILLIQPSARDNHRLWYASEKHACDVAGFASLSIAWAPLVIIGILGGLDRLLIAEGVATLVGFIVGVFFVEFRPIVSGLACNARPWILRTILLPTGIVCTFFVDRDFPLDPGKGHGASFGILAIFLMAYLAWTVIPTLTPGNTAAQPDMLIPPHG